MTEKQKFREKILESGTRVILGRDETTNDELMKKYKGKSNVILHTVASGSPFGVIDKPRPSQEDITASAAIVARYSQDWRDNKSNVDVSVFTGKDISKDKITKLGMWHVKKSKKLKIKKQDIEKWQ